VEIKNNGVKNKTEQHNVLFVNVKNDMSRNFKAKSRKWKRNIQMK
jgi:hypothetical protein